MEAQRHFTGRKKHRHEGRVHFAEVTVRAEPCLGETEVVLSEEVSDTLREVFGPDFEHQKHCVCSAVVVQISTINVAGQMPHAGAASFRAEVVYVKVSGNAGRDVSGFLLSVAGMDAIAGYLIAWENEREDNPHGSGGEQDRPANTSEGLAGPNRAAPETPGSGDTSLSEEDLRCAVYQSVYVVAWNDISDGLTEAEIRRRYEPV